MAPKVVLVTGVSGYLGGHLAARLAGDPSIERVVGVDTAAPRSELRASMGRAEFVRADIRNPLISKVISTARVDTVVHASLTAHPAGPSGRSLHKEMNVIGTMQLLAACQRAPLVRRLVVKSTAAVYGSGPRDPAAFTEEMAPTDLPSSGYAQDNAEVEGYVRGFGRRRPDVSITTLRFVNLIGPRVDTVLTRYFALPGVVPTVLGRDARLQLLHAEDALAVLARAVGEDLPGVFNVAGDGVLLLSQAIRRAGRAGAGAGPVGRPDRADAADHEVRRLRLRADPLPELRPGRRHHEAQGAVRLHPEVDDAPGVRRLRARPGSAPDARSGPARRRRARHPRPGRNPEMRGRRPWRQRA